MEWTCPAGRQHRLMGLIGIICLLVSIYIESQYISAEPLVIKNKLIFFVYASAFLWLTSSVLFKVLLILKINFQLLAWVGLGFFLGAGLLTCLIYVQEPLPGLLLGSLPEPYDTINFLVLSAFVGIDVVSLPE